MKPLSCYLKVTVNNESRRTLLEKISPATCWRSNRATKKVDICSALKWKNLSKYCQYLATCLWSKANEKFTYCTRDVFLYALRYEMKQYNFLNWKIRTRVKTSLWLLNYRLFRLCYCGPGHKKIDLESFSRGEAGVMDSACNEKYEPHKHSNS